MKPIITGDNETVECSARGRPIPTLELQVNGQVLDDKLPSFTEPIVDANKLTIRLVALFKNNPISFGRNALVRCVARGNIVLFSDETVKINTSESVHGRRGQGDLVLLSFIKI